MSKQNIAACPLCSPCCSLSAPVAACVPLAVGMDNMPTPTSLVSATAAPQLIPGGGKNQCLPLPLFTLAPELDFCLNSC